MRSPEVVAREIRRLTWDALGNDGLVEEDGPALADLIRARDAEITETATAENARLRAGIEALHRPVHFVFSWSGGLRHEDPCPECNGKAGVHPCGCWADEDMSYECLGCSLHDKGDRRVAPWPCPTATLLNPPTEGEADHADT